MQNTKTNSYFIYFSITTIFCVVGIFALIFNPKQDHLGELQLNNDFSWYMNFKLSNSQQCQDRDIFYHDIGQSIKYAKQADILILGHSMVLFGFDWRILQDFAKRYNIKIFNMAMASETSGEFALRIIEKYHLHPSIWVLNADDHDLNFFSQQLHNGKGNSSDVVSYSRWHAYKM